MFRRAFSFSTQVICMKRRDGKETWSTRPERVRMLFRPFVGMAMTSVPSIVCRGGPAVVVPRLENCAANSGHALLDLIRHDRLAVARDFGRIGGENVVADPLEYRIVQ